MALVRIGIELYGRTRVRDKLFPLIRAVPVLIRPPAAVAFSSHLLHGYKIDEKKEHHLFRESLLVREMAHAEGALTIYLEVPSSEEATWSQMLMTIGYWGQTNSFASCLQVRQEAPRPQECAIPLQAAMSSMALSSFFSCILSEFRDSSVSWEEIDPFMPPGRTSPLKFDIYVWPLRITKQHGAGKVLVRMPLQM